MTPAIVALAVCVAGLGFVLAWLIHELRVATRETSEVRTMLADKSIELSTERFAQEKASASLRAVEAREESHVEWIHRLEEKLEEARVPLPAAARGALVRIAQRRRDAERAASTRPEPAGAVPEDPAAGPADTDPVPTDG